MLASSIRSRWQSLVGIAFGMFLSPIWILPVPGFRPTAGGALQPPVRPVQRPTIRDRDDGLALFAGAAQVDDEICQGVERQLLAASVHQRLREPGIRVGAEARLVIPFDRVDEDHFVAIAPVPALRQKPFDRRRLAREREIEGGHRRRHDRDEIFFADDPVQRIDERLPDVVRAEDVYLADVEKDDEHARARILKRRARLGDRVRLAAHLLRDVPADDDVLELFDLLGRPVLEDLEVALRQIRHRRAVSGRIDVDANVVGLGVERRLGRLRGLLRGGGRCDRCGKSGYDGAGKDARTHGHVELLPTAGNSV
ncbi:MAG TPA: hypothetical protein VEU08_20040 [Vicinamibacterales bacterium]|nr:hypothetical protein [Vicinamibacterales bacterium]